MLHTPRLQTSYLDIVVLFSWVSLKLVYQQVENPTAFNPYPMGLKTGVWMSVEAVDWGKVGEGVEAEDEISYLSDFLDASIALYKIGYKIGDGTYESEAIRYIFAGVSKWLEIVGPLNYYPGLIEKLSDAGVRKLWEADLDADLISEALKAGWDCKIASLIGGEGEMVEYCREVAAELLKSLGVDYTSILKAFEGEAGRPEFYSSLIGLTLVLATNI